MPSWNDGETSEESWLGDFPEVDYAPDSIHDDAFCGIDADANVVCRVHKVKPERFVAFEGTNTGRRFYACSVHTDVVNCGFVSWIDPEWPEALQKTLARLWGMYEDIEHSRFEENHQNAELLHNLAEEKKKVEEKYTSLLNDVKKWMDATEKKVQQENMQKIKDNGEEQKFSLCEYLKVQAEKELSKIQKENEKLKQDLFVMTEVQKSDSEVRKIKQKRWDDEREELKEEKKKLEYNLYDLLKASEGIKEKIKRIKEICEE